MSYMKLLFVICIYVLTLNNAVVPPSEVKVTVVTISSTNDMNLVELWVFNATFNNISVIL